MAKIEIAGVEIEIDNATLTEAVEKGTAKIETDLIVYKPDQFEAYKTNLANEEYKKGKVAGEEMNVKALKQKTGLDFEGKNIDTFIDTFKSNILEQAKIEPSKKIQELEADKQALQKNYSELETTFNSFKSEITEKETRGQKDKTLLSVFPEAGIKVQKEQALILLKTSGYDVDIDETGNILPKKGSDIIKDPKTLQPIELKAFVELGLKELGLMADVGGGRGAGDAGGGAAAGSYEAFVKEMENNNVSESSIAFKEEMVKRIKSGTLKV